MGFQGTFKGTLKENFDRMMNPRKFLNEMDQFGNTQLSQMGIEQDTKKLQQDNGSRNLPPNQGKKITVNMKTSDIIRYATEFFKWRGVVDLKKVSALGSSDYDRFIEYLYSKPENIKESTESDEMDESTINEADNINSVISTIKKVKNSLINKWNQKGGYENFGDKEYRALCAKFKYDPYGTPDQRNIAKMLDSFAEWAMNYDGSGMDESTTNEADNIDNEDKWEVKNGEIYLNGKRIKGYEFDRDSDAFWIDDMSGADGQLAFDTKDDLIDYVKKMTKSNNSDNSSDQNMEEVVMPNLVESYNRLQLLNKKLSKKNLNEVGFDQDGNPMGFDNSEEGYGDDPIDSRPKKGDAVYLQTGYQDVASRIMYIDATHIYWKTDSVNTIETGSKGGVYHIGQLRNKQLYNDLLTWMNTGDKTALETTKYKDI